MCTLGINTIPSYLGCLSSNPSPHVFDNDGQLISFLKEVRERNQSSVLFSGTHSFFKEENLHDSIKEANKVAVQKGSVANRYRHISKVYLISVYNQ